MLWERIGSFGGGRGGFQVFSQRTMNEILAAFLKLRHSRLIDPLLSARITGREGEAKVVSWMPFLRSF